MTLTLTLTLLPLLTTSLLVSSLPHLPPFPTRHYLFTTLHFTYLHLVIATALLRLHYISLPSLPYPLSLHFTLSFRITSLRLVTHTMTSL